MTQEEALSVNLQALTSREQTETVAEWDKLARAVKKLAELKKSF